MKRGKKNLLPIAGWILRRWCGRPRHPMPPHNTKLGRSGLKAVAMASMGPTRVRARRRASRLVAANAPTMRGGGTGRRGPTPANASKISRGCGCPLTTAPDPLPKTTPWTPTHRTTETGGNKAYDARLTTSDEQERKLTYWGCVRRMPVAGRRATIALTCATSATQNDKSLAACERLTAGEDNGCRRTTRTCAPKQ